MTWLLTGGAGYIGAHIVRSLRAAGFRVVVLDDLSTGLAERVPAGVPLVEASVLDREAVVAALREYQVRGVIHLAAKKAAGESVERPLHYYKENVTGFAHLLEAMVEADVDRIVFSSSSSVYGNAEDEYVPEDAPKRPESPYGETKLICEWLLHDVARASGLRYASLRYFNVAGAGDRELGDTGVFNLIPMTFQALTQGRPPQVFGDDYPTRDGSCVRDYIHVGDLADAHLAAARRLEAAPLEFGESYNVGRGEGSTVKEVLETVRAVTGQDFEYVVTGRRAGDPAQVVALADKIRDELGWVAKHELTDMVASAWEAWQAREGKPRASD
jgi:UDP-glucose 4-epimerase